MASHTKIRKFTATQYRYLASAILFSHDSLSDHYFEKYYDGIERASESIADYLQAIDPNFNKQRFLKECGIEE
jgi:hypothetical protein